MKQIWFPKPYCTPTGSGTWVGSLFASHINRKCSHFNRRLVFSLLTIPNKIQENFCKRLGLLIRIQTIIILEPIPIFLSSVLTIFYSIWQIFLQELFFRLDPVKSNQGASSTPHASTYFPFFFWQFIVLKHDCLISCVCLF